MLLAFFLIHFALLGAVAYTGERGLKGVIPPPELQPQMVTDSGFPKALGKVLILRALFQVAEKRGVIAE